MSYSCDNAQIELKTSKQTEKVKKILILSMKSLECAPLLQGNLMGY